MLKLLQNSKYNIIAIIVVEIIALAITFTANYSGAGMAAIVLKWIPAFIGIITLLFYFISKLITKKHNWIVSLIGIVFMLIAAINIYLTDFSQTA